MAAPKTPREPTSDRREQDQHESQSATPPQGDNTASKQGSSNPLARFAKLLGPGLIAGAADDDPTGIATYAQAGAQTGYGLLWTAPLTVPMMIATQYLATKIAVVRHQGLTSVMREHYPHQIVYGAIVGLLVANIINAAADTGAIAAAITLVFPFPDARQLLVLVVGLFLLAFMIWGNYNVIQNTFKWLTLALLAYVVSAFLAHPDWGAMLKGTFIPHIGFNVAFLSLFVATLGGNVSPYLIFWQSDMEVAEEDEHGDTVMAERAFPRAIRIRRMRAQLKDVGWDTVIGFIFSNVIVYFIEVATAATLFVHGITNVTSAPQAALALRPLLGNGATILWAIGMLGSGMLAVPALTGSAANAVSAIFGWQHGLEQPPRKAWHFYAALTAVVGLAMLIEFLPINPIQALVISADVNGILTPPLLVLLMLVGNRRDVMGDDKNSRLVNIAGWGTIVIMSLAALGLLLTMF